MRNLMAGLVAVVAAAAIALVMLIGGERLPGAFANRGPRLGALIGAGSLAAGGAFYILRGALELNEPKPRRRRRDAGDD